MTAGPTLLATKLFVPRLQSNRVARPRLIERLNDRRAVTLISAPAGFGKTTLLADWVTQQERPVAWLSLDELDNDPTRFWAYLIAALQTLQPDLGRSALSLLHAPQAPPAEAVLTLLLNELATFEHEMVVILDDYHLIENGAIHQGMAFLFDHLPVQTRLIVTSRADPPLSLARWRGRGQLTELRAADLRFTPDEGAAFLKHVMNLNLSADDVAALDARTEGWIAGLQLAALSMQGHHDVAGFIAAFTGSNRYIVDYLAEEVLQQQPEPVQTFLLRTSILDRLTGSLCDAVTGQTQGQALLEQLERANLLLIPLDEDRQWYRYHQLFGEVLRRRLQQAHPDLVADLHRRASEWLQHNASWAEAVQHMLAAKDWERAAALIERVAESLLNRGEYTTLRMWFEALPEDMKRARPRLCLSRAATHILTHQLDAAEQCLQEAEQAAQGEPDHRLGQAILSEAAAMRAGIAINSNELARTIELAQQALGGLPADNLRLRGLVTFYLGLAYFWSRQDDKGSQLFMEARRLSEAAGDINTALTAMLNQAVVQYGQSYLHQAFALYQRILALAEAQGLGQMPIIGLTHANMGYSLYEWNDLQAATLHLQAAIELSERVKAARSLLFSQVFLSQVLAAQGQLNDALEIVQKAESLVQTHHLPVVYSSEVAARRARLWLAQGNLKAASDWADTSGLNVDDELASLREVEYFALARVLMARGESDQAVRLLARMRQAAEAVGRLNSVIQILALEAVALRSKNDTAQAFTTLERALALAEPEGYIRTFVDADEPMREVIRDWRLEIQKRPKIDETRKRLLVYTNRLLAAFPGIPPQLPMTTPQPHPTGALRSGTATQSSISPAVRGTMRNLKSLPEPLSERELEVLRLVAIGLSDRQIAEQLIVAVGTVKRHLNSVYGKLGVHSRAQALARAKELGVL